MTKDQIVTMLAVRKDAHHLVQKRMHLDGITMSCLNCEFYNKGLKNPCTVFDASPPPEILVFSCVTHWEQEIPF